MRRSFVLSALVAGSIVGSTAVAAPVPSGTVSSVALFNPIVLLSPTPSGTSTFSGGTFELTGTGGFAPLAGTTGTLNGSLAFSNTPGTTVAESVPNFFVFSDARGGTYNYSVDSVRTNAFVDNAGLFSSGTLYLLGALVDANLAYLTPTATSVTIQFNSTGGSAFASSLTLATPPNGPSAVPEPAAWAMMIIGFGLIGSALRRRRLAPVPGLRRTNAAERAGG